MRFGTIFYVNGILLLIFSMAMMIPALIDLTFHSPDWKVFAGAQLFTGFFGFALVFMNRQETFHMTLKETFLMTSFSWVFLAAFGALPFVFSEMNMPYSQAFFESMSGITTTGSTVIVGLDTLPYGILFWRHMLQWLGGIGFLIIALAILPLLQISGMQIFKTQSSQQIDKVLPNASQLAVAIFMIYIGLTVICAVMLHFAGMTVFESFCHAMSTIATGGFSTADGSIGHFNSAAIEYIIITFMIMSGIPFVLYLRFLRGDREALFTDSQVRTFLWAIATLSFAVMVYTLYNGDFYFISSAIRKSLFMVVALITGTGFTSADYSLWGPFVIGIAFVIGFMGACSGSTSGGIKLFRLQLLWMTFRQQLKKLTSPHGVFHVNYNGKRVDSSIQASVAGFFFVYVALWVVIAILLQLTGLDFVTAFSGSMTAISNVGPALGDIIGPAGTFSTINDSALWILSFAMLAGRLEFLTLFVLFIPRFWKA